MHSRGADELPAATAQAPMWSKSTAVVLAQHNTIATRSPDSACRNLPPSNRVAAGLELINGHERPLSTLRCHSHRVASFAAVAPGGYYSVSSPDPRRGRAPSARKAALRLQ